MYVLDRGKYGRGEGRINHTEGRVHHTDLVRVGLLRMRPEKRRTRKMMRVLETREISDQSHT